jgi:phosphopantothenoylcysteine synthetase/decarboxylase
MGPAAGGCRPAEFERKHQMTEPKGKTTAHGGRLRHRRFLITSGPQRATIDAIRYLANTSTGRLGSQLATEALDRGAAVTYLCGPGAARPDPAALGDGRAKRLKILPVETFDDLMRIIGGELGSRTYDAVLHAMAVLDYVPEKAGPAKTPSGRDRWRLSLVPTPKVIDMIKRWDPDVLLIGFKLEVDAGREKLIAGALETARRSGADLMVANDLREVGDDRHRALLVDSDGRVAGEYTDRKSIAAGLFNEIEKRLSGGG